MYTIILATILGTVATAWAASKDNQQYSISQIGTARYVISKLSVTLLGAVAGAVTGAVLALGTWLVLPLIDHSDSFEVAGVRLAINGESYQCLVKKTDGSFVTTLIPSDEPTRVIEDSDLQDQAFVVHRYAVPTASGWLANWVFPGHPSKDHRYEIHVPVGSIKPDIRI